MRFQIFYRKSLRDAYDHDPPKVYGVAFEHVATLEVFCEEREGLDTVFRMMNAVDDSDFEVPQQIKNRSMSVGDVVVREVPALGSGLAYVCCGAGWAPVADFDADHLVAAPNAPVFQQNQGLTQ